MTPNRRQFLSTLGTLAVIPLVPSLITSATKVDSRWIERSFVGKQMVCKYLSEPQGYQWYIWERADKTGACYVFQIVISNDMCVTDGFRIDGSTPIPLKHMSIGMSLDRSSVDAFEISATVCVEWTEQEIVS